jgi:hypothetical protein
MMTKRRSKPAGYVCVKCKAVYIRVKDQPRECNFCKSTKFKPLTEYKVRQMLSLDEDIEVD